jgi:hypothetical protein
MPLTVLPFGPPKALLFAIAVLAGMIVFEVMPAEWRPSILQGGGQPAAE